MAKRKATKKTTPISTTTEAPTPISSAPQPPITASEPKSDEFRAGLSVDLPPEAVGLPRASEGSLEGPPLVVTAVDEENKTITVTPADVPESAKFAKLVAESKMLTEFKLQGQLARLINSGCLPNKQLWQTDKRHQVAKMALAKCKDVEVLKRQWPMIRWLRGRTLGNARNEMMLAMSWVLLGVITELMVDDIACES
ncbi:MAG TPA: hypothetical protein VMY37_40625 [Thermoguttaceae bacterium]|nr:hypothetical protein [Thermoguttaceae bacterium]